MSKREEGDGEGELGVTIGGGGLDGSHKCSTGSKKPILLSFIALSRSKGNYLILEPFQSGTQFMVKWPGDTRGEERLILAKKRERHCWEGLGASLKGMSAC